MNKHGNKNNDSNNILNKYSEPKAIFRKRDYSPIRKARSSPFLNKTGYVF